jgi:TolA-binding protein
MKRIYFILMGCLSMTSLWGGCDHLDFARALEGNGYVTLSIENYESALEGKEVGAKDLDEVYLSLYKLYGRLATQSSVEGAKSAKIKAESYFSKIKGRDNPVVQLEKVKSGMESLRRLEFDAQKADEEALPALKKKAKEAFLRVAEVTQKIRVDSRTWLGEYESMEEKAQKKARREYQQQSELEANSNLQFGEACIIYAAVVGYKDPDVVKWLNVMSKGYEDFIANYYGSFAAIFGGVYYGQVCILLGEFTDDYGSKVDGLKAGATSFEDAIAGLEEFSGQRGAQSHVKTWMINAHVKHSDALVIIGKKEKAIDVLAKLFDVLPIKDATPKKDELHHDRMMSALQTLCVMLKDSYVGGNRSRVNAFAQFVLKGFNFTKKVDSKWHANFRKLLGALPADDDSIVETLDIASMKADNLYSKASKASEAESAGPYFLAALKYKKVIEMALIEGDRMDEFYPKAAYRLGKCYFTMENYLLALGIYLRAVDLYPSTKYNEKKYPSIYSNVLRCATSAKAAAIKRYILAGKTKFDQELYERTLNTISQQFPEEGGDPEFWLGYLRKSSGDYEGAISQLSKISKESKMYYKSQYAIVDCEYMKMTEDIEKGILAGDDEIKVERNAIATRYESIAKLCSEPLKKSDDMSQKDFDFLVKSQSDTLANATQRMASLYYQAEEYKKTYGILSQLLSKAKDLDKFNAIKLMTSSSYQLGDLAMITKDITSLSQLKTGVELSKGMINDFQVKAFRMKANLLIQQQLNPLLTRTEGLKGKALEAVESELSPIYVKTADLYFDALKLSGDKDEELLKPIIGFYYSAETGREKALEAMNLYFEWYPNLPELDRWHGEMIGKSSQDWDQRLGGVKGTINLPVVKKVYEKFLDELFDQKDYALMSISQVKTVKKETGDGPRSYQVALKTLDELEAMTKKDLAFKSKGWPKIEPLRAKLKEANGYYGMRYQQAECLTLLKRYDEATNVFKELSKYFVEYPQVRIELAKAEFAQGTKAGYDKANQIFKELLSVVPSPNMGSSYSPKDYYYLQLWYAKSQLAIIDGKPSEEMVIETWKLLRGMLYQDLDYIAMESYRFNQLKISSSEKANHVLLIEELKLWVESEIFPVLSQSKDPLASDSWKSILGEDS